MSEKLKVAVCDDDKAARQIIASSLKSVFAGYGVEIIESIYPSASILNAEIAVHPFDLILLDIDMPGMDGISFARKLRELGTEVDIIYISNREDKVFQSLATSPDGFIRKSRFLEDMSEVIGVYLQKRQKRLKAAAPGLVVPTRSGLRNIPIEKVLYVEGSRKNQLVYTEGEEEAYPVSRSMQELEEELGEKGFIRIHKGYLVNYRYIRQIDHTDVLLTTGALLPLSRRKLAEVKDRYLELMQESGSLIF